MLRHVQDYLSRHQNEYKWIIFAVHMRGTKFFLEGLTRREIQITYYLCALTSNLIANLIADLMVNRWLRPKMSVKGLDHDRRDPWFYGAHSQGPRSSMLFFFARFMAEQP